MEQLVFHNNKESVFQDLLGTEMPVLLLLLELALVDILQMETLVSGKQTLTVLLDLLGTETDVPQQAMLSAPVVTTLTEDNAQLQCHQFVQEASN